MEEGHGKVGEAGLIETFFFPIVEPWRRTEKKCAGSDNAWKSSGVGFQVEDASANICGVGDVVLERGVLEWSGKFFVKGSGGSSAEIENIPDASNRAADLVASSDSALWGGHFDLQQVQKMDLDKESLGITFTNLSHQQVAVRFQFECAASATTVKELISAQVNANSNERAPCTPKTRRPKKSKKRNDRRASISFDDIQSALADIDVESPPIHTSSSKGERNTAPTPAPAPVCSVVTEIKPEQSKIDTNQIDEPEDNWREMIREFVKSPQRLGPKTQKMLSEQFSYDLSLVNTPTKDRVAQSPPKRGYSVDPGAKQLGRFFKELRLKPILTASESRDKQEKSFLQEATQCTIIKPKGSREPFRYIDRNTNCDIDPKEYARRYLQAVPPPNLTAKVNPPAKLVSKRPTFTVVATRPADQSEQDGELPDLKEIEKDCRPAATPADRPDKGFDFEQEMAKAEKILHASFDKAIASFVETRTRLERLREKQLQESSTTRSNKKTKSNRSKRRQSLLIEGFDEFMRQDE